MDPVPADGIGKGHRQPLVTALHAKQGLVTKMVGEVRDCAESMRTAGEGATVSVKQRAKRVRPAPPTHQVADCKTVQPGERRWIRPAGRQHGARVQTCPVEIAVEVRGDSNPALFGRKRPRPVCKVRCTCDLPADHIPRQPVIEAEDRQLEVAYVGQHIGHVGTEVPAARLGELSVRQGQRPEPTSYPRLILENPDIVAGTEQGECCGKTRHPRTKHEDRLARFGLRGEEAARAGGSPEGNASAQQRPT